MHKIFIFIIPLLLSLNFSKDLNQEQQVKYNKNKLSIEKRTHLVLDSGKEYDDYILIKGNYQIDLEQFATICDDRDLLKIIKKNRPLTNLQTWLPFAVGTALLVIPQDENGVVEDWARIPAIGSFALFIYYLLFKNSKVRNSEIIPFLIAEEMVEKYNNKLLKEVKSKK